MEIFYFGTDAQKIGPLTKEGLIRLAEAGVVTEQTDFEVNGQRVKGRHIKNLRPIFENQKRSESANPADSTDIQEGIVPPPILEPTEPAPTVSDSSNKLNEDFYQSSGVGSDSPDGKTAASFDLKAQDPFRSRVHDLSKKIEENETRRQLRSYTKFRWCYRIIMTILLIGFLIAMGVFITGYVSGLQLKHAGYEANWRLHSELRGYLNLVTYQALGFTLDCANSEKRKKERAEFIQKVEKLGFYPDFDDWLVEMEKKLRFLYDYDLGAKRLNKQEQPETLCDKGKALDDFVKERRKDSPDFKLTYSLEEITLSVRVYLEYADEKSESMQSEGAHQAEFFGKNICILLASYLIILLPYFFMSAMVCSAEKNHRTMILLEEVLKSKKEQEVNRTGNMP